MSFTLIRRARPDWYSLPLNTGATAGRVLACRDDRGLVTILFDGLALTGTSFLTQGPTGLVPAGPTGAFALGRAHVGLVPEAGALSLVDVRVYRYGIQLHTPTSGLAGKILHGQFTYRTDDTGPISGVKL